MRPAPTLALLALLLATACSGGGGGGAGNPARLRDVEPNDLHAQAFPARPAALYRGEGVLAATGPAGDVDRYRLPALATGLFWARVESPPGSDFDLELTDGDGALLAAARSDQRAAGALPEEWLFLEVTGGRDHVLAVVGHAGPAGGYRLTASVVPDPLLRAPTPVRTRVRALDPMAAARCFFGMAPMRSGRVLVAGGCADAGSPAAAVLSALASTGIWSPERERFEPGPDLHAPRFGPSATRLADGRVLVAGGDLAGTADLYDPERDVWAAKGLPLASGTRFLHTATLLPDGRVLLAGGVRLVLLPSPGAEPLATTEIFDPKGLGFSPGPDLAAPRTSHAACLLPDGRVLVAGGEGRAVSELVTPEETAPGPALGGVRDDHTLTLLPGGRVLLAGGQGPGGASLDTLMILDDPANVAFRPIAARMSDPRSDHVAIRLPAGEVLLMGGESDPGTNEDEILVSVDLFDPADESVTPFPALTVPRDDHRAVRLPDGRILVAGGEDSGSLSIPDAEAYDPR